MGSKIDGPSGPRSRFFIVGLSHFQRGIGQYTWLACKPDISEEVRNRRSDVISWLFVVPRPHTLIFDHSFHCTYATCNNKNGHKTRCSEQISGTKALQFVTFWKFLSLTENTGEHRSKDIDHIYGVQNWWSEWSQITIFLSWTSSFSAWYWPLYMASMQNRHFWRSEKSSI